MASTRHTSGSVTLGHIRGHGCRDLLVYCRDVDCDHSVTMNANHLPDDTAIRPLGKRMVCSRTCRRRGQPDGALTQIGSIPGIEMLMRR
jgi:hypothetical protein